MGDIATRQHWFSEEDDFVKERQLKVQLAERKARLFASKQEKDKCEQQIRDIREGKVVGLEASIHMLV